MPKKPHKNPCHCCHGSGKDMDNKKTGSHIRALRLDAGLTLRELARRMKISHSYLHQLEHGRRNWNLQIEADAEKNIY